MAKTKVIVKEEPKYVNIPVSPTVYEGAQLVAQAKGFGKRGLGALVAHWVGQELPECEHEKEAVSIEYFGDDTLLPGQLRQRTGYYCPTCNRVFEKVTVHDLAAEDGKKLLKKVKA